MDENVGALAGRHGSAKRARDEGQVSALLHTLRIAWYSLDAASVLLDYILELLVGELTADVPVDIDYTASEDTSLLRRSLQSELGVSMQRPGSCLGSSSTLMTSRAAL